MAGICSNCGVKLGMLDRMAGVSLCKRCLEEYRRLKEEAKIRYPVVLQNIWNGNITEEMGAKGLKSLVTEAKLNGYDIDALNIETFHKFANDVLSDDILTEEEEHKLLRIANVAGITQQQLESKFRDILFRLTVARINDGRLPVLPSSKLVLKRDEVAHLEMSAKLLKEVTITEYQGGYSGFSFRIVKGVRYHIGGVRGRRVAVGTELKEDDNGILVVTSQRAVFLGSQKTLEMLYKKLLSMDIYEDGIRFHLTNRQRSLLFKLESVHPVAAVINFAIQRLTL